MGDIYSVGRVRVGLGSVATSLEDVVASVHSPVARHTLPCNVYSLCLSEARTVQCWLGHSTLMCNG